MSNEELAIEAQQGKHSALLELWKQVERFAGMQAGKAARKLQGRGGITEEDLKQTSFIALGAAVKTYQEDGGSSFLNWYSYYLRTAFAEASGSRNRKPLDTAISLNAPVKAEDEEGITLEDTIQGPDIIAEAEDCLYNQELAEALYSALDALEPEDKDLMHERYWNEKTRKEIAQQTGSTVYRITDRERKGLQKLSRDKGLQRMQEEEAIDFYHGHSLQRYLQTQQSSVERKALRLTEGGRD